MVRKIRILYIRSFTYSFGPKLGLPFFRISNFLHLRIQNARFEELYLDLEFEDLPNLDLLPFSEEFSPNLDRYKRKLTNLLFQTYNRFEFDLVAISCYESFNYINTIEIALIVKKINPLCIVVVGGVHPSILSEEFQPKGIPKYFDERIPTNTTPFDYLIKGEGEIPFYKLVKSILRKKFKKREIYASCCKILPSEYLVDLNDLPIINLKLLENYKNKINKRKSKVWLDFSRGCMFECSFCLNSRDYMNCYKKVRLRSVEKCLRELEILDSLEWLSTQHLHIADPIFIPKKSMRGKFLKELEKIRSQKEFRFKIHLMDRIDLCSDSDLEFYKKLDIIPHFGLENVSHTLLSRIKKVNSSNITNFLKRFEYIIKKDNELGLHAEFFYMITVPGETKETINESRNFFLSKRFDERSLVEKYRLNLAFGNYINYPRTEIYETAERKFGTKFYFKHWWRFFDNFQHNTALMIDPSENFTFFDSIKLNLELIKEIYLKQMDLGNPYYTIEKYNKGLSQLDILVRIYNKINMTTTFAY